MKRKITALFLIVVLALTATVFATACGGNTDNAGDDPATEHKHSYVLEVAEEEYLASEATCTEPAKYYKSCECGAKGAETFASGQPNGHSYVLEVAEEEYLASEATCTEPAKYYKSCECGAKGAETFASGQPVHRISYEDFTVGGDFKRDYLTGEAFDMTGMTVSGKCDECGTDVTAAADSLADFTVAPDGPLASGTTEVTVIFGGQSAKVQITVTDPHVESYEVTDIDLEESGDSILYVVEGTYTGTMTKPTCAPAFCEKPTEQRPRDLRKMRRILRTGTAFSEGPCGRQLTNFRLNKLSSYRSSLICSPVLADSN